MRVVEVSTVAATLALVVFASASVVLADGRVALWSANSTHAHIGRLPNPGERRGRHDGRACSGLGFDVTTELDADRGRADRNPAGVHAAERGGGRLEMDGVNYVVPVDARLPSATST